MRNRKGYTKRKIEGYDGEVIVCDQHPHLGVTDAGNPGWYWVLHTPSAAICAIVEGQDASLALVAALGTVDGLEQPQPAPSVIQMVGEVVGSFRNQRKPKKKQPPAADQPVGLEPVYAPGVTPSPAVRTADRELAAELGRALAGVGDREALQRAARGANTLAWRELLMAEVNQVLANPDETPEQPYRLLDGTLCTWEGFRAAYKRLIVIGNNLQVGAIWILELADELAEQDTPPTREQRERWRKLEEEWIALIHEGWQTWGEAVSHFLASPEIRQQQVKDKLGYIGSRERGFGALGRKTFLRHPEVAEASKARRLVRYEREARRGG